MKGRGNARMMQCGYHAWTYDLSGCLKSAPRTAAEPGFRLKDYPLLPLRVDTLGPWVFVNADQDAEPLARHYDGVLDIIAASGLDLASLELHSRTEWDGNANWKTMLENFLECYHCAIAHPGFSAAIDVRPDKYDLSVHGWFCSQVGQVSRRRWRARARSRSTTHAVRSRRRSITCCLPTRRSTSTPAFRICRSMSGRRTGPLRRRVFPSSISGRE